MALWVPWRRFKAELDELREAVAALLHVVEQHQRVTEAGLRQLKEEVRKMAGGIADMDEVLQRVADGLTKLGNDLKDVFAFIKANPNVDLSTQIAKGNAIADQLTQVDADALAEENPLPPPSPGSRKS